MLNIGPEVYNPADPVSGFAAIPRNSEPHSRSRVCPWVCCRVLQPLGCSEPAAARRLSSRLRCSDRHGHQAEVCRLLDAPSGEHSAGLRPFAAACLTEPRCPQGKWDAVRKTCRSPQVSLSVVLSRVALRAWPRGTTRRTAGVTTRPSATSTTPTTVSAPLRLPNPRAHHSIHESRLS